MARFAMRWWTPFVVTMAAALATLSLGPARHGAWGSANMAFATVLALTGLCAVGSVVVLTVGVVRRLPEVVLLGSVLWAVSLLGTTHGLLLPGHLYGTNPGSSVAMMAAVPGALLAALPLLLDATGARGRGLPAGGGHGLRRGWCCLRSSARRCWPDPV